MKLKAFYIAKLEMYGSVEREVLHVPTRDSGSMNMNMVLRTSVEIHLYAIASNYA